MVEWSDFVLEVMCEKRNSEILADSNNRGFDRRTGSMDKVARTRQHTGRRSLAA